MILYTQWYKFGIFLYYLDIDDLLNPEYNDGVEDMMGWEMSYPFLTEESARNFVPIKGRRGIVDECCYKSCSTEHLKLYCAAWYFLFYWILTLSYIEFCHNKMIYIKYLSCLIYLYLLFKIYSTVPLMWLI